MKRAELLIDGACLALPGAAANITLLVGVMRALERASINVVAASGSSSGAIIAATYAAGMDARTQIGLGAQFLDGNRMLRSRFAGTMRPGFGLYSMGAMRTALEPHLPKRMGDGLIPWGAWAVDLETQQPVLFRSDRPDCSHLHSIDVVLASAAVPFFFEAQRIRGRLGYYTDGGVMANIGADVWDDDPRPTVVVRLGSQGRGRGRTAVKNPVAMASAVLGCLAQAASRTHVSRKHWALTATIELDQADAFDFSKSLATVRDEERRGYEQMARWLDEDIGEEVVR